MNERQNETKGPRGQSSPQAPAWETVRSGHGMLFSLLDQLDLVDSFSFSPLSIKPPSSMVDSCSWNELLEVLLVRPLSLSKKCGDG